MNEGDLFLGNPAGNERSFDLGLDSLALCGFLGGFNDGRNGVCRIEWVVHIRKLVKRKTGSIKWRANLCFQSRRDNVWPISFRPAGDN
jgi:hypothetical protein